MALKQMPSDRLAHCAWIADIDLMVDGCCGCWTYKLLQTMSRLEVIDGAAVWDQTGRVIANRQTIMQLQLVPATIKGALQRRMALRWAALHPDPRLCTFPWHRDVYTCCMDQSRSCDGVTCETPKHLQWCAVSFVVMQCLARLRLGGHDLQIRLGKTKSQVPRHQQVCRLCSKEGTCGRTSCTFYWSAQLISTFEIGTVLSLAVHLHLRLSLYDIFDCEQLAHAVYTMTKFREFCLMCAPGTAVTVEIIQQAVEADIELTRISLGSSRL